MFEHFKNYELPATTTGPAWSSCWTKNMGGRVRWECRADDDDNDNDDDDKNKDDDDDERTVPVGGVVLEPMFE